MSLLDNLKNTRAFKRAQAAAGEDEMVCGVTGEDGAPRYFVVSKDTPQEELRARAFEARYGRPMNRSEELLAAAMNGSLVDAYERAMSNYLEGRNAAHS